VVKQRATEQITFTGAACFSYVFVALSTNISDQPPADEFSGGRFFKEIS